MAQALSSPWTKFFWHTQFLGFAGPLDKVSGRALCSLDSCVVSKLGTSVSGREQALTQTGFWSGICHYDLCELGQVSKCLQVSLSSSLNKNTHLLQRHLLSSKWIVCRKASQKAPQESYVNASPVVLQL